MPIDFTRAIKILLIEDDPLDANWVQNALNSKNETQYDLTWCSTLKLGCESFKKDAFDIIVSDLNLPDGFGLDIYNSIRVEAPNVPIIFLTGEVNEESIAIEAMAMGAQDYLMKGKIDAARFRRALTYAYERQSLSNLIQEKNKELNSFAHTVTHDLRSPVMSIIQLIQMILEDSGNHFTDESKEIFDRIIVSGERLDALVRGVYDFYCVSENSSEWEKSSLENCVSAATDGLRSEILKADAKINFDSLPEINMNPVLISQVFQNLISNAIKYCKDKPIIKISTSKVGEHWVVAIADNGIGIAEKDQFVIFEMLKRLHRQDEYPGRGIGLATCKKIIEFHNGEIWLDSTLNKGSTFYFSILEKN